MNEGQQEAARNCARESLSILDDGDTDLGKNAKVEEVMGGCWVECCVWVPDYVYKLFG